ncbi:MAG: EamA family transporter [Rhizobiaceae bacterium]|nr:EamA family transporter [Rhizobiaceae bacterium]
MTPNSDQQSSDQRTRGALAIFIGAGVWGLFWIPLRHLTNYGLEGLWAVAVTLAVPLLLILPLTIRRIIRHADRNFVYLGLAIGLSVVLYFGGVLFSDVVRVVFLFYMLPIWTTILGRLINGETIGLRKLVAIALALSGLYLLLGGGGDGAHGSGGGFGIPLPANIGDWFGLAAGILWASSLVLIRHNSGADPVVNTIAPLVFGTPVAVVAALLMWALAPDISPPAPTMDNRLWFGLVFAGIFGLLVLVPSIYGQVWGARMVPSSTAALLTMIELITASVSAYLLIGTSLGPMALAGGVLIACAAVLDLTAPIGENE